MVNAKDSRDTNRIGDQCWYNIWDSGSKSKETRLGFLRMWGMDYEELNSGVGNYPIAVIEDCETMKIVVVRADWVTFC